MKFGAKYKWFKISYLEFFFWKHYFRHTFSYSSTRSSEHHQSCFLIFRFCSRKSQCQQKLTKKINHLTIQFLNFGGRVIFARCLGLVKCFTILHFNWNFLKFNHFSASWSIYNIKAMKFSRQFGLPAGRHFLLLI